MTNVTPESRYTPIQHCQCHLSINQATNMLIIGTFYQIADSCGPGTFRLLRKQLQL